ncbi:hypothetical protein BDV96DRAFT_676997 [Lophiotrema nucula]|uniref:Secreted protein NIS1 n=1 Tax=Lophiotrema nucula TaxID=690887 RepID=A0A6A5YFR6_9PLEO|nr:hypothetical protein BDV96DRAFT_676997 [Lophiotrema nucula]
MFSTLIAGFALYSHLLLAPLASASARNGTPFGLQYVFSANLTLGSVSDPIPIYGGVTITETITNGTVFGPVINATIQGGAAFAEVYQNQTIQVPTIDAYGSTSDGLSFAIHETGIGSQAAQMTRITIDVGETKYSRLTNGFILAAINRVSETEVSVEAYLVFNTE